MTTRTLAVAGAALEAATGIILFTDPRLVVGLLIGASLSSGGVAVGRVCGIGLFSFGLACWPSRTALTTQATSALFTYNLLSSLYIAYLGFNDGFGAYLLWPACILHASLALLLARPAYEALKDKWLAPSSQRAGMQ